MALILASQSPRRKELLGRFGLDFVTQSADIDESPLAGELPWALAERLALGKARWVFDLGGGSDWVLGGDTVVAVDDRILGKPRDRDEAIEMLSLLSGRAHRVLSAVALVGADFEEVVVSETLVTFDRLSLEQISEYCDSGEPFDKAGGYGIQGVAEMFVKEIRGSYSGVVGLPLFETRGLLTRAGLI